MAYKDPITWEIVSIKSKKKIDTKLKKVKSKAGEIVWFISPDLRLKIGKIESEKESSYLIKLRDNKEIVEVASNIVKEWNDDDYY